MFSTSLVIVIISLYMAFLFAVAQLVEKRPGGRSALTPYIYALSLTVYFTSWSFYGNVGFATESGLIYLGTEFGSVAAVLFWWYTVRRMVRIKETYHITDVADFISVRYSRSQAVAALVTLTALFGIPPYIALQLKSIVSTISIILPVSQEDWDGSGLMVMLAMAVFTVLFGARRLDPTERHPGVTVVLALQGLVKIAATLAIGIFVVYGQYGGFGDIFDRIDAAGLERLKSASIPQGSVAAEWITLFVMGMVTVQCLPRQFHLLVVENSHERDIFKAMLLFVVFTVLFDLFVIPIAGAGLLQGLPPEQADEFVLRLPYVAGADWLTLLVFVGGFSAASGMIIISTMTLSTMATNHLLLPVIEGVNALSFLRHYLLPLRWLMIVLIIIFSYGVAWAFSGSYMLVAMGTFSFVAVVQFAPAMLGGMVWRRANRVGAVAGLGAGLLLWFYTLVVPAFIRQGWIETPILEQGPWQITWLHPEALFGVNSLSPLSHSMFWSLVFNILFLIVGSWIYSPSKEERTNLVEFLRTLSSGSRMHKGRPTGLEAYIPFQPKYKEAVRLLSRYLPEQHAVREVVQIAELLRTSDKDSITIIELVEFHRMLEMTLSGSIGAASAHRVIETGIGYSEREKRDLQAIYSHIAMELGGPSLIAESQDHPAQADTRYNFVNELQQTIEAQQQQIEDQNIQLERLKQRLERSDAELFEQRILVQKLTQEIKASHGQNGREK
ncbi:sodium:solute symporter family protein [Marinobacterium sp. D7]|uniref:sodium:solute symporter family protein n=1 Tax=Marinobacterium ramblicola TaxID=2849041 RepID=UPI001C2D279B|nr:sodium:solute symporter family protein [Marinobacterium ramblicola]MBV1787660.1 sodium:solute symporter family protein [Marinobacterium ramblicola]